MPKNAQGSWVGKKASPIFPTYQTAGTLRPPLTSTVAAPAPPPSPLPQAQSISPQTDRNRLIDAIIQTRGIGGGSGVGIFGIPDHLMTENTMFS